MTESGVGVSRYGYEGMETGYAIVQEAQGRQAGSPKRGMVAGFPGNTSKTDPEASEI